MSVSGNNFGAATHIMSEIASTFVAGHFVVNSDSSRFLCDHLSALPELFRLCMQHGAAAVSEQLLKAPREFQDDSDMVQSIPCVQRMLEQFDPFVEMHRDTIDLFRAMRRENPEEFKRVVAVCGIRELAQSFLALLAERGASELRDKQRVAPYLEETILIESGLAWGKKRDSGSDGSFSAPLSQSGVLMAGSVDSLQSISLNSSEDSDDDLRGADPAAPSSADIASMMCPTVVATNLANNLYKRLSRAAVDQQVNIVDMLAAFKSAIQDGAEEPQPAEGLRAQGRDELQHFRNDMDGEVQRLALMQRKKTQAVENALNGIEFPVIAQILRALVADAAK